MNITLPALVDDPSLYLFSFDFDRETAQILQMDRAAFHRSIFLDGRIERGKGAPAQVALDALLTNYVGPDAAGRPVGFIFHVAQCGSTLLARALDHPGTSLSLREPYALRQLGVLAGGAGQDDDRANGRFGRMLEVALSMLGKRWPGEDRVVIKANVPVNLIAERIMAANPAAPAVTLYFTLADYVAAVMRTEGHCQWVETVFAELQLAQHPAVAGFVPRSTAERAAALWFVQMEAFAGVLDACPETRSIDAAGFLDNPMPVVRAAAELFGIEPGEKAWDDLADGELFTTYSKNPTLDYDPEVRVAREAQSKARLRAEIAEALSWARGAQGRRGLPDRLAKPLIGESPLLLSDS